MKSLFKFIVIVIGVLVGISNKPAVGNAVEKTQSTFQKKFFQLGKSPQMQVDSKHDDATSERRVTPWVSVAVLLNFLFFFRYKLFVDQRCYAMFHHPHALISTLYYLSGVSQHHSSILW